MATPTNHTASSLFDFRDLLEPEPSQDSLEQHSSIDNSTILISGMNEASNHSRLSSNVIENKENSNITSNKKAAGVTFPDQKSLTTTTSTTTTTTTLPVKEETAATAATTNAPQASKESGILKPSSFPNLQAVPEAETPLAVHTEYVIPLEIGDSEDDSVPRKQAFSPTVHTSNQTPFGQRGLSPHVTSPTVKRNNRTEGLVNKKTTNIATTSTTTSNETAAQAEQATAWAIHLALLFFCGLILACVLLTVKVVHTYGFLTLLLMACVLSFCAFLACFVDSTILSQNPKLKPVREAIVTVVNVTKQNIAQEYHLFMRDWKENMLLLTEDGEANSSSSSLDDEMLPTTTTTEEPQRRRKKSKVFQAIKPFLGFRKKFRRRKKNKETNNNSTGEPVTSYEAPEI